MDESKPTEVAEQYAPLPIAWSSGMGARTNREWLSGPHGGEAEITTLLAER